jgi:HEAT repeats/SMI1 / KNR4 family (SUKH-1)
VRDWREVLESLDAERIEPGASEEQLAEAEARLGVSLPPDFRAFLLTANGFGPLDDHVRRVRGASELRWLRDEDPELVRIWSEASGDDSLSRTLVVSDEEDGARVLLNPAVVSDGEWKAWFFAHWVPGAEEFGSFRELIEELHARFVDLQKAQRGEPTPRVAPGLGVDAEDLDGLVAALQRPSVEDRVAALDALANLRNAGAAPAVIEVLRDPAQDDYVRETAARTLGQLRDERSVAALLEILREEAAIGLKHAARQGLLTLGGLSRPALGAALADPDPHVRAEACQVLCYDRAAAAEAIDRVAPLVHDEDPDVRLTLVTHVEQLFQDRGREVLLTGAKDADPRVAERARSALARLDEYGL